MYSSRTEKILMEARKRAQNDQKTTSTNVIEMEICSSEVLSTNNLNVTDNNYQNDPQLNEHLDEECTDKLLPAWHAQNPDITPYILYTEGGLAPTEDLGEIGIQEVTDAYENNGAQIDLQLVKERTEALLPASQAQNSDIAPYILYTEGDLPPTEKVGEIGIQEGTDIYQNGSQIDQQLFKERTEELLPALQAQNSDTAHYILNPEGYLQPTETSSESEDRDDSSADPPYEVNLNGNSPRHVVADSNTESNNSSEEFSEHQGRPKKGRKRKYKDQNRGQKKTNKDSNKAYFNYKGRKIEPKPFNDYRCDCPKKCTENVLSEKRKEDFTRFWSLESYNAQTNFIAAAVTEYPKQRLYGRNATIRAFSRKYKLGEEIVCRNTFVKTLGVSTCRVNTALKKFHGRSALTDQRGITGGKNKLPDANIQKVVDQINRIPRYISHYCRSTTEANFLPPDMTIQKMYNLYCSEEIAPVSISTYKRIFYSKFNLRMKPIKKDTCNTCDKLKTAIDNEKNIDSKEELKNKHDTHLQEAKEAQDLRRQDFKLAKENDEFECLTFDLEKTLPLPRIPTNIVFYKRQLWVYNAGVHSGKDDRGYCYVWVEGTAGRGSQEVGSCLLKHIKCHLPPNVKHLILWSDACGGQNRNIKITLLLKSILHTTPNLQTITMNFLISGHSFLPNDSDFSDIECELKRHQRLYTPDDYLNIMRTCRKKKPFIVTKMQSIDFFGVEQIEKNIVNRKATENKEKINWLHIRSIKLDKDEPFYLSVKQHKFTNPFQKVNIKKNVRGRPFATGTPYETLVPLWPQGKPIALPKLQNLNEMIHLIPSDALEFYSNLKGNKRIIEDVDGFNTEQLDFDVEEEY